MWFLSIIFCCALAFVNQFFWFRQNAMVVSPLVIQLISFPIGKFMEKVIPKSRFFNPGPFNIKEHVLITVMANCSVNTAYAVDIITIQRLWYGQDIGWGGGLLLIWTTQVCIYICIILHLADCWLFFLALGIWSCWSLSPFSCISTFHGMAWKSGKHFTLPLFSHC